VMYLSDRIPHYIDDAVIVIKDLYSAT